MRRFFATEYAIWRDLARDIWRAYRPHRRRPLEVQDRTRVGITPRRHP